MFASKIDSDRLQLSRNGAYLEHLRYEGRNDGMAGRESAASIIRETTDSVQADSYSAGYVDGLSVRNALDAVTGRVSKFIS